MKRKNDLFCLKIIIIRAQVFKTFKKKKILYGTDLILFTYSYSIHQCTSSSTQAANIPIYPGLVRGDGKDNDCDGKVDEERLNGIGMFQL